MKIKTCCTTINVGLYRVVVLRLGFLVVVVVVGFLVVGFLVVGLLVVVRLVTGNVKSGGTNVLALIGAGLKFTGDTFLCRFIGPR